ncbi:hypothetical protein N7447_011267 [Penicillium robsamsonii]|uniref:uncharacterized protein n=1 Tax=Penicillium robsamsonii TaxID=1792511 RepID=UPI002547CAA3|nr:uncharacterized protein N7447_011299 [Penicillium robsamsonii]XP_057080316.1 uncharacterized protein N7447_011243 [Penicillium robsamsonii]XP_057080323.1 uncharacterized protein N7447_011261 [Penicillium robsamsonii]XP_057080326.1 uncharacterized protein N7447_011267 [Penicillium robsamsonii]KAJ5807172.1 hypothetical protein N7447_011299 [Penicillium robsamsonii]KAJ5807231.1 hypothetical protein N7447_011243 [Penicillium robsamsonii]KAJ5807249.1 hypothetical protein N7447_011261 [Penicilli
MTTQAGVALSEASPQRKPRPQRLRECHAVGAPAQARYPPGAKVVISAPLSRGSLFWLAGRRNHRPQCPHRKSPPLPKCREGLPLRAPLRDPGQGGKPTGEYPKLPYAAPRGRGILPRLPSVEFPPAPPEARPPANWQTSTPAKSPASKPQWRPGPIMLPACHPLPTAPSRKRRLQALLSPQWCPPTPPFHVVSMPFLRSHGR